MKQKQYYKGLPCYNSITCGLMSVSWVARLSMQLASIDCSRIHWSDLRCISLSSDTPLVIISFHDFVA